VLQPDYSCRKLYFSQNVRKRRADEHPVFAHRDPAPCIAAGRRPSENLLYVAELLNWRVQKLILH